MCLILNNLNVIIMEKIRVVELIDFRNKSDKRKKSFAFKLKNREAKIKTETKETGGGNYWVTSTSCIYNVFKYEKKELYDVKTEELFSKYNDSEDRRIKSMYQRNIDILNSFIDFDLENLKPNSEIKYEKIPKSYKVFRINELPIYVNPSVIYTFEEKGISKIGALWLVPKLYGFKKSELGMFCEILYSFLVRNYSDNYQISEEFSIVVDTFNAQEINYKELKEGEIPFLVNKTIDEINSFFR
nr:hypothetical protein BACY1_11800 [Tenacibaculum mesophilum]